MALSDRFLQNTPTSLPGNLNTAESEMLNQTKLSDESIRSRLEQKAVQSLMDSGDPQIREMVGSLLSAGTPIGEVLRIIQSRMDSMATLSPGNLNRTEMEMLNNSAPVSRFNQGGIVSLRRLTRPLGY